MIELCRENISVTVFFYRAIYALIVNLCSYLNAKELLPQNQHIIWTLTEYNRIQNHMHLLGKRMLNHLAKLIELLSRVVRNYLALTVSWSCHTDV